MRWLEDGLPRGNSFYFLITYPPNKAKLLYQFVTISVNRWKWWRFQFTMDCFGMRPNKQLKIHMAHFLLPQFLLELRLAQKKNSSEAQIMHLTFTEHLLPISLELRENWKYFSFEAVLSLCLEVSKSGSSRHRVGRDKEERHKAGSGGRRSAGEGGSPPRALAAQLLCRAPVLRRQIS